MWSVKVNREQLLKKVVENKTKHHDTFLKAMDKYKEKVLAEFEKKVEQLKKGKLPDTYLRLPVPEEHVDDYDTVIGMLKMSTEDLVELGDEEFANFVEDRWNWSRAFAANTVSYTR